MERGEIVANELKKSSDNENINVSVIDLGSMSSIKCFAKEFNKKESHLDILINNAGILTGSSFETTEDGYEKHFGVNILGTWYLTKLLLPKLRVTKGAKVISLSSLGHWFSNPFYTVNPERACMYFRMINYCNSKMGILQLMKEFNRQENCHGIRFYSVHPGIINTGLWKNFTINPLTFTPRFMCKNTAEGAATTVYCAVSKYVDITNESGLYYSDCKVARARYDAYWESKQKKVWKTCESCCGDSFYYKDITK